MASNILILGSTGFVGGVLVNGLQKQYCVTAPKRQELDLSNYHSVSNYFRDKSFDVVINCAGNMESRLSPFITNAATENLLIFNNLYAVRKQYQKLINIGSGAEFDRRDNIDSALEEDIFLKTPTDHYGLSKNIVSRMTFSTDNFYTLRLFGVFGNTESKSRLLKKVLLGEPIKITDRYFDYFYINDLIPVVEYYINHSPTYKDINVVYPQKLQLSDFLNQFCEIHNLSKSNIELVKERGLAYTGNANKLADLKISFLGLTQGLKDYNEY